jgi:stalled ribosome rescue protein Dom34
MTHHFHAVVWIDHAEARIFEFGTGGIEKHHVRAEDRPGHIHHKAGTPGPGHDHEDKKFFDAVAAMLKPNHEILVVGHGPAKTAFAHYARDHKPDLARHIMGVEAVDQPSEGELLAFARKFFDAKDRTTPQR